MRKSRFSEAQIAEILKEGEAGVPVADLIPKHGISRPTYHTLERYLEVSGSRA
jgi:putative transposase